MLRNRQDKGPDLDCNFASELVNHVKDHLGLYAVVDGVLITNQKNGRQSMDVESISAVSAGERLAG